MKKLLLSVSLLIAISMPVLAEQIMMPETIKPYLTFKNLLSKPISPTVWMKQRKDIDTAVGVDGIRLLKTKPFTIFYAEKIWDKRFKDKMQQKYPNLDLNYVVMANTLVCIQNQKTTVATYVYDRNNKVVFGGKIPNPKVKTMNNSDMAICKMVMEGLFENEKNNKK